MLETSAFQIYHRGNSTFIISFDKTKFSCFALPPMLHHSFFRNQILLFPFLDVNKQPNLEAAHCRCWSGFCGRCPELWLQVDGNLHFFLVLIFMNLFIDIFHIFLLENNTFFYQFWVLQHLCIIQNGHSQACCIPLSLGHAVLHLDVI